MPTSPLAAMLVILRGTPEIQHLVEDRVFDVELPEEQAQKMPRACVVLRRSGGGAIGPGARSYINWTTTRMDAFCYGKTPLEASFVHAAVEAVFVDLRRTLVATLVGDTLLHNAVIEGGPLDERDPDSGWPFTLGVYAVFSDR